MSQNAENFYIFLGVLIGLAVAVLAFLWFYVPRSMKKIERSEHHPSEGRGLTGNAELEKSEMKRPTGRVS